jgi:2-methylcitrate dehydratase PrpD
MRQFVQVGNEDPMSTLCRMVSETKYEDLPSKVVDYAKHSILDAIAITIGGSAMEGIPTVVDLVKEKGGKPESIIPFYGGKVPASEAGFAIGPMTRAMDAGDVHTLAGHSSEFTVPTLLAATGLMDKVSGKEFITAFAVGQEVLIRIGMAYKAMSSVPISTIGGHSIFGSVAAAGKLLGLSLEELQNAEGIALEMTQPHLIAMYVHDTLIVRVHHGFICQDAINACLLAKRGITGPRREVLVGTKGYLSFARWKTDPSALTKGLGEQWEMLTTMMKPYVSCKATHTSIYGIIDQMKEYNFEAEDIAEIHAEVCSRAWTLVCAPKEVKWNPQTVAECQFSLPYAVATAAYNKTVFLDSYTPQAMARQNVRDLMPRLSAKEDPSLPQFTVRLRTTLKDGRKCSKEYAYVKGHPQNPFTEQDLIEKFKKCVPYSAYKLSDEAVDSLIKALLSLETVNDVVDALLLPLTPK